MPGNKQLRGIRQNVRPFSLQQNLRGVVQNKAQKFLMPTEAVDIVNMHSLEEGSWSADKAGYTKINASGTAYESGASVDGLTWYTSADQEDHLLIGINGKLKEVNTSTGAATDKDASAGYTVGGQVDFQALNNILFSCDGSIATPRKWDNSTAANSGGWPVTNGSESYTKPKFVEEYQGRLAYGYLNGTGSNFFPSHILMSNQNAAETFTFPATLSTHAYAAAVGLGDGQKITGFRSIAIPASNDTQLVIFKDRSIYALTGSSALLTDEDVFSQVKINSDYGAFNNRCIVPFGNEILALNEYGVIGVKATIESGNINTSLIESDLIKKTIDRLNYDAREKCWGIHLKDRREVWFFLPTGSSTQCNEAIVYRYPTPGSQTEVARWSRRTDAGGKFKMAHGTTYKKTFYVGSYTGIVGSMFTASKYDTVGIPWQYKAAPYDFGNERQIKRITSLESYFRTRSTQSVLVETAWLGGNNNDRDSKTIQVETAVSSAIYGAAIFGQSYYGEQEEVKTGFSTPGNGQRWQYSVSGTTNETGPEFLGLSALVEFGGHSQHWN